MKKTSILTMMPAAGAFLVMFMIISYAKMNNGTENKRNLNESIQPDCIFIDPDTSISGINLRSAESVFAILGSKAKWKGGTTHVYFSSDQKQELSMIVHPGDPVNQVSIFNISYADEPKTASGAVNTSEFITEKGVKLGMSKKDIIQKLGNCYMVMDSTKETIEMHYTIEISDDSRTKLLHATICPSTMLPIESKKINLKTLNLDLNTRDHGIKALDFG
jgi:hypothetical protein